MKPNTRDKWEGDGKYNKYLAEKGLMKDWKVIIARVNDPLEPKSSKQKKLLYK